MEVQPGLTIPDDELTFTATRSGGPGGQHVNKTSSKILLRFDLAGSNALSVGQKERLKRQLPPRFLTAAGEVLISSDEHRDQKSNREAAVARLRSILRQGLKRPKRRVATKPTRGSKERRLQGKKETGQRKQQRGEDLRDRL